MKKLTDDPAPEAPKPEMTVTKTEPTPVATVTKKSNVGTIVVVVLLIVATIGLIMLYNHFKNRDGNKPEPNA